MVPIEAPCYAVPLGANNIDALVDGLWCDGNFQCLDVDMKPIEGLFAVGNASGPFFGNSNYPMDIEGLSVGLSLIHILTKRTCVALLTKKGHHHGH